MEKLQPAAYGGAARSGTPFMTTVERRFSAGQIFHVARAEVCEMRTR